VKYEPTLVCRAPKTWEMDDAGEVLDDFAVDEDARHHFACLDGRSKARDEAWSAVEKACQVTLSNRKRLIPQWAAMVDSHGECDRGPVPSPPMRDHSTFPPAPGPHR